MASTQQDGDQPRSLDSEAVMQGSVSWSKRRNGSCEPKTGRRTGTAEEQESTSQTRPSSTCPDPAEIMDWSGHPCRRMSRSGSASSVTSSRSDDSGTSTASAHIMAQYLNGGDALSQPPERVVAWRRSRQESLLVVSSPLEKDS
mmetsp:Transcript_94050/g.130627  ORF Transcript_94050/g.130627 Transcript_94050/m.130627 type:complete len:144 (-) Transcript_94050:50-481(-)